jgi:UDP-GlcNAc:undecaprenyl-phosphate/decaprenyl-phosphate GlcNAc-1-phosphate transferase
MISSPWIQVASLLVAGLILSLLLTRLMIRVGPKLGLMDQPDARRVHVTPIPRAGGMAVWVTFMISALAGRLFFPGLFTGQLSESMNAFALSSGLLLAVGIVDDRGGIKPLVKLTGQIAAAGLFFLLSPDSNRSFGGFEIPYLIAGCIFTGWAVLLINAFNLIDGLDGLCGGLVTVSLFVIAGLEIAHGALSDALVIGLMMVAVAGFLRYNLNPARIFLGDAGSMMLGFFLASAATQAGGRRAVIGSILLPIAIAGVPLLDVLLAIWRRSTRNLINRWQGGEKVGVFSPDKDHLHHRFLARGINQRKVSLLLQGLAAAMAILTFVPLLLGSRGIVVTASGFMLLGLFGLRHLAQVEFQHTGSLVHLAVKRRHGPGGMRRWYFLYDLLALGVSGVVAMGVETNLGARGDCMEVGVRFVTAFMACEMLVLHLLRIYRRVWSRSSMREFVLISLGLMVGGAMASCIFQATSGELAWSGVRVSLIAVGAATWLLLVPRALPEIAREFAIDSTHRFLTKRKNCGLQIMVYGAGDMGNLFVQHLKTCSPRQFQTFQVSGFLDDNPNLRHRTINGFKVHGDLDQLDHIVASYPVHGILIAIADLAEERLREILRIAENHGLAVYQWTVDLEARRLAAGQQISAKPVELWRPSDGRPEMISAKSGLI